MMVPVGVWGGEGVYTSVHVITFGHRTISDQYTHMTMRDLWSVKMSERVITLA